MDFTFRLPDAADDSELEHLHEWLLRARDLRTFAEISKVAAAPEPDRMGLSLDAVELILNSGFQLASLALAIVTWRKSAEPRSALTVRRGDVEVTVSREGLESVENVLEALEQLARDGDPRTAEARTTGAPVQGAGQEETSGQPDAEDGAP